MTDAARPVRVITAGQQVYVIPRDADRAGATLDLSLFDVSALAQDGNRIPVTVRTGAAHIPGVRITRRTGRVVHGYETPASAAAFGHAARADNLPGIRRVSLATPVRSAARRAGHMQSLDLHIAHADGVSPTFTDVVVTNLDDASRFDAAYRITKDDQRVRVPAGHYAIIAMDLLAPDSGGATAWFAIAPSIHVGSDARTVTLHPQASTENAYPTYSLPRATAGPINGSITYGIRDDRNVTAASIGFPQYGDEDHAYTRTTRSGRHGHIYSVDFATVAGASTSYGYFLTDAHPDAVFGDRSLNLQSNDLSAVRSHIYGDGRPQNDTDIAFASDLPYQPPSGGFSPLPAAAPRVDTSYLYGPSTAQWRETVLEAQAADDGTSVSSRDGLTVGPRRYAPGHTYRTDFFRGPLAPGAVSGVDFFTSHRDCEACRTANQIRLGPSSFVDSADHTNPEPLTLTVQQDGSTSYHGPAALGADPVNVPIGRGSHRLRITAVGDPVGNNGAIRSTAASTTWALPSSTATERSAPKTWSCIHEARCFVLPLLTVTAPLPTDLNGALPAGVTKFVVTVGHVLHAAPSRISHLSFAAGPDDGKLVAQRVSPLGGGKFLVSLDTPDAALGTGIATRITASDADGSSIHQTVRTAYFVAGRSPVREFGAP